MTAGERAGFYRLAGMSSGWNAWATPQAVLDSLCEVLGGRFDLDPCASRQTRLRKHARRYLTEDDDGLSQPWHGRVYINPPYGPPLSQWTAKAVDEVAARRAELVIGLIPARTDTRWWHTSIARAVRCLAAPRALGVRSRWAQGPISLRDHCLGRFGRTSSADVGSLSRCLVRPGKQYDATLLA